MATGRRSSTWAWGVGLGGQEHSKAQRWEELPKLIDDDVLHQFVVAVTYDTIGTCLLDRYADLVTDIELLQCGP